MLIFIKLGGSLITDKNKPQTPRQDVIDRLAEEIAAARKANPGVKLLVGHGSGSFGHIAGKKYGTRQGVSTPADWLGYAEVWHAARTLNQIVVDGLTRAGLPVIAFPASASAIAEDGLIHQWSIGPLQSSLNHNLIPLVYGDVVVDLVRGGTILSTEDQFYYLARKLKPQRILIAGIEPGVWGDFPACKKLVEVLTPQSDVLLNKSISGSKSVDVTGGMAEKVALMLNLIEKNSKMEALIFSGQQPGNLYDAICNRNIGTLICTRKRR